MIDDRPLRDAMAISHKVGKAAPKRGLVEPMPPERVQSIRRALAKNTFEFQRRFGVPARTLEGWEQGRKMATSDRILLSLIERAPDLVERVLQRP